MMNLSNAEQDSRFLQCALSLAIRLNAGGPRNAVRPLTRKLSSYFYFCAIAIKPLSILRRITWAVLTLRVRAEIRLIRFQRNVCAYALAKDSDVRLLLDAIQTEREAWEQGILGKCWSAPAMTAIWSATQIGISWRDAVRTVRAGKIRFEREGPVPAKIRPVAAGLLIGVVTLSWFAAISYNMFVLNPRAFAQNLLVLGGGFGAALWNGYSVYAITREEKNLVSRLVNACRPRIASKRAP
jgi:hypothetical protein